MQVRNAARSAEGAKNDHSASCQKRTAENPTVSDPDCQFFPAISSSTVLITTSENSKYRGVQNQGTIPLSPEEDKAVIRGCRFYPAQAPPV